MANPELSVDRRAQGMPRVLLLPIFTTAIFVSAALLFMVQPMFTKLVLPRFGGAPAVWSVAIVFFQAALLAGYAYAHWLTRYVPGRTLKWLKVKQSRRRTRLLLRGGGRPLRACCLADSVNIRPPVFLGNAT